MIEGLRLAVASAYPPNRGPLSEYAWHVVQALGRDPRVEHVHVLADRGTPHEQDTGRVSVHQCWSFGGVSKPFAVARMARRLRVDAVWFHLHMTSGGTTRLSQFANLAAPAVCRMAGIPTIVTLHNMLGLTDLSYVYPGVRRVDVFAGHVATMLLRAANQVCVPLPEYVELLRARYGIDATYVPLGSPGVWDGDLLAHGDSTTTILAFGRFGTYKRLDVVLDAFESLQADGADVRLIVAGANARRTPGYLERLQARYAHLRNIEFAGYVDEADVPALFRRASFCVLPYATMAGMSSVAMQAAMYGVPIIASSVPGIRLFEKQGLRMTYFEWPEAASLKKAVQALLASPQCASEDVAHNLKVCRAQRMSDVVDHYLHLIETVAKRPSTLPADEPAAMPAAPRLK